MLYQMLFGKRPFGEGCTQEKILRDEVMLNARAVTFPSKPSLSAEGRDFITRWVSLGMLHDMMLVQFICQYEHSTGHKSITLCE